jgi:hypothetical protein
MVIINSVLGLLHRMVVGDIAHISEVHSASIFYVQPLDLKLETACTS